MNDLERKVIESSDFYRDSILKFDYQLANYGFQTLRPFFKGNMALELGPATGYMTKLLVDEFETLHLIEGSQALLNEIPDYPNVVKKCSFFENYETEIVYDTIIMSHVLEHIKDPVVILKKIFNWLKADGNFLVAVPNAKSMHRLAAVEMGMLKNEFELNARDTELGHYRVYDTDSLRSDLLEAGFQITHNGGYFLKPLSNSQIEKNWTEEMIDGFFNLGKKFPEYCAEIYFVCTK